MGLPAYQEITAGQHVEMVALWRDQAGAWTRRRAN
jgi:hypothetical protein